MAPLTAGLADSFGWLMDLSPYLAAAIVLLLLSEVAVLLGTIISTFREP